MSTPTMRHEKKRLLGDGVQIQITHHFYRKRTSYLMVYFLKIEGNYNPLKNEGRNSPFFPTPWLSKMSFKLKKNWVSGLF